jgi:hypothetical protein
MPTTVPPGFLADANITVLFVTTLADPDSPSLATEINAVTTIDMTCYLTAQLSPNATEAISTDDRMCLRQALEVPGTITYSIDELQYVYDVQNPASLSNELYAAVPRGTTGFIVIRYGEDVDTAFTAGDIVDVYPVEWGQQIKMPGERNTKAKVRQKPYVVGPYQQDVAIAA